MEQISGISNHKIIMKYHRLNQQIVIPKMSFHSKYENDFYWKLVNNKKPQTSTQDVKWRCGSVDLEGLE